MMCVRFYGDYNKAGIQFDLPTLMKAFWSSVAAAPAWSRLRAIADTGSEPSRTELIPNKEAASQIQLELQLQLRSWLKPAWPSS